MISNKLQPSQFPVEPLAEMTQSAVLDRMVRAVELVRVRLLRSTKALNEAGIPYAVIGGNAVAYWVAKADEAAVRNTADVDLLIRRTDLAAVTAAMTNAGFVFRHAGGIDFFTDGPEGKFRDAIHLLMTSERVRPEYLWPAPDVTDAVPGEAFQVLSLPALVRMKLTSFRDKDRMHLRDMLDVGIIDATWLTQLPEDLAGKLQQILADPEG